jgi:hypothetical protein
MSEGLHMAVCEPVVPIIDQVVDFPVRGSTGNFCPLLMKMIIDVVEPLLYGPLFEQRVPVDPLAVIAVAVDIRVSPLRLEVKVLQY